MCSVGQNTYSVRPCEQRTIFAAAEGCGKLQISTDFTLFERQIRTKALNNFSTTIFNFSVEERVKSMYPFGLLTCAVSDTKTFYWFDII